MYDNISYNIFKNELMTSVNRTCVIGEILKELKKTYKNLLNSNKGALITEWLRLNSIIGNSVKIRMQNRVISGIAEGTGDMGELIVK